MSDMEEAPARLVRVPRGNEMETRLHSMGDVTSVRRGFGVVPAKVLVAGTAGGGGMT